MTKTGDTIELGGTKLLVLVGARPSTRDGNFRIRARVLDGEFTGEELWLLGQYDHGPWETPGAGFV